MVNFKTTWLTTKPVLGKPLWTFTLCIPLLGCAAAGTIASVANVAMEVSGLKRPEVPDAQKPPRTVQLRFNAANALNTDSHGRSLALLTKVYKLKQNAAFEQATYDTFLDPEKEKAVLGADLLEVKEVVLIPGQAYVAAEKVSREAYFIGVVSLYRSPYSRYWRATFSSQAAEKQGVSLSMLACAFTVDASDALTKKVNSEIANAPCPQ